MVPVLFTTEIIWLFAVIIGQTNLKQVWYLWAEVWVLPFFFFKPHLFSLLTITGSLWYWRKLNKCDDSQAASAVIHHSLKTFALDRKKKKSKQVNINFDSDLGHIPLVMTFKNRNNQCCEFGFIFPGAHCFWWRTDVTYKTFRGVIWRETCFTASRQNWSVKLWFLNYYSFIF